MDITETKIKNLRRIMYERKMSQGDLAIITGKTKQQINNVLKGRIGIGTQLITEFSQALDVEETEFFKPCYEDDAKSRSGPVTRHGSQYIADIQALEEVLIYGSQEEKDVVLKVLYMARDKARLKKASSLT